MEQDLLVVDAREEELVLASAGGRDHRGVWEAEHGRLAKEVGTLLLEVESQILVTNGGREGKFTPREGGSSLRGTTQHTHSSLGDASAVAHTRRVQLALIGSLRSCCLSNGGYVETEALTLDCRGSLFLQV